MTDVEMPREKPRGVVLGVLYRLAGLSAGVLGRRRVLSIVLDLGWLAKRLGHELSVTHYGHELLCETHALSPDVLRAWIPPSARVLDVGCGPGRVASEVAPFCASVVGIDIDERAIAAARAAMRAPNVEFRALAAESIGAFLDRERFDAVLLVQVLEHVDDPVVVLRSLASIPLLVVEVPDLAADPLNVARLRLGRPYHSDADHLREYTVERLERELAAAGWSPLDRVQRGAVIAVLARRADASGEPPLRPQ